MPKIALLDRNDIEETYFFYCPGCRCSHFFRTRSSDPDKPLWKWNGDFEKPTVTPSIDVNRSNPEYHCHFFMEDGKLRFLDDCFHHLKNQVIEMSEEI